MPKVRVNLRELDDLDDQLEERHERAARDERARDGRDRRPISPLALERRQAQRKFGKDIARFLRERKSDKP